MSLIDHDQETVRKYFLGQLPDDQQQTLEERLFSEDELAEEFDLTREELVDEYLAKELTATESAWFEQHFLASPEGKRSLRVGLALHRYTSKNPSKTEKRTWSERLAEFWNRPALPLRTAALVAVVVVVVGIVWISRPSSPRTFATLTIANSASTRSGGPDLPETREHGQSTSLDSPRIKLLKDALRLTLLLPANGAAEVQYRVDVMNDKGEVQTPKVIAHEVQSVTVQILSSQLPRGQYAVTLHAKSGDGTTKRIPGSYYFTVE